MCVELVDYYYMDNVSVGLTDLFSVSSLFDVLHHDRKLYLVFEYVDYDLKKYMDKHAPTGIPVHKVKVRNYYYLN